jgi:hypothetical protein
VLRADLFYDDVAHHVFWLYRYLDPTLFPGDPTVPYFHTSAPWGYRALYAAVAPVADIVLAAKLLSIVLLGISCWLAWQLGRLSTPDESRVAATRGLLAVIALIAMLSFSQQRDLLPPIAFQRTFALPLLLFTLWALVSRRYRWVGISWLAAALLYPVVLPVQGLTAVVVFLHDVKTARRMPAHWVFNGLAGLSAIAIATFGVPVPPEVGPPVTYREAIEMPEFGPEGRLDLWGTGTLRSVLTHHRTGLGWSPWVLLALAVAILLAAAFRRLRQVPFAAWAMLVVGVGLWAAMCAFPELLMFDLYLPNRHSRWAVGIFGMMVLVAIADSSILRQGRSRLWAALAAPGIVAIILLPNAIQVWNRPLDSDLESAYEFIASLPTTTMVAAHPDLADFVPVRTRRSVLASTEVAMPWMKGYYAQMKPRVTASLRAAYATRIEDVDAALAPYAVDVLLTGPSAWEKEGYFVPFDGIVRSLRATGERDGFVLRNPPTDRVLFRSGDYYVIKVKACNSADC